ncbi:MAG: HAD-IIIA family hydrolase [Actinobacteria bacterium]|nr:MAG: HAD-IIIA family hydrolase [Actinomycetota bacterium]
MRNKAVFLDRDGTIIKEVDYLKNLEDLELIPGSAEAIGLLNKNSFKVIMATNQSGVARGYYDEHFVQEANKVLAQELEKHKAYIDGIYYCPHHPEVGDKKYKVECDCRKPRIAMFKQASDDFSLDLAGSYTVGDKAADILAGKKAGCKNVLVLTGYGLREKEKLVPDIKPDFVADDLLSAVNWILKDNKQSRDIQL